MINIQNRTFYKAFGLNIESAINLPELIQVNKQVGIDISIEIQELSTMWKRLEVPNKSFIVGKDFVLFRISDTAIFGIFKGKRIVVSPLNGSDINKIRLYILGTCMGTLLMQRRILPLHGSVVSINGLAYAFIGDSEAGKSTLASVFINSGHQLLSDDVIAVINNEDYNHYVVPSYPQQKLWQESLNRLGMDGKKYAPLFERETKFAVPIEASFYSKPLQLAGIFELEKYGGGKVDIKKARGLEALRILNKNTYRKFLINRLGIHEWHFNYLTNISSNIDIFKVCRPNTGFTSDVIAEDIIKIIKKRK